MTIKFDHGRIRLWEGSGKDSITIGIRFNEDCGREGIEQLYENTKSFLTSKYGEGVESEK